MEEDGFLAVIRQTPADDTARLVYADWLDEQDGPLHKLKAEFIRLEHRLAPEPADDYSSLLARLQRLAASLDAGWVMLLTRARVEGCTQWRDQVCPGAWSRLEPTPNPGARTCGACRKSVFYSFSVDVASVLVRQGYCIVLSPAAPRTPGAAPAPRPLPVIALECATLIERPRRVPEPVRCIPLHEILDLRRREDAEVADAPPPDCEKRPEPGPPKRKRGRGRNRNLQRENWEESE